jgi:ABC-type transport system involved in cytochrome c biogenesis permease subunit
LVQVSNTALVCAIVLYAVAFFAYTIAVIGKRWSKRDPASHSRRWSRAASLWTALGLACHLTFFITRWVHTGRIPTANMFEFMTFLAMMVTAAFLIIYAIYRSAVLGVFAMPVVVMVLLYAAVFPWEAQPLVPSLQHWMLRVHVTTAAAGEAFFAIGFAAGLIYLLRTVNFASGEKKDVRERRGVELILFIVLVTVGFILAVFAFRGAGYEAAFERIVTKVQDGKQVQIAENEVYTMPPLIGPYDSELVKMDRFLGMEKPLFEAPGWMNGENAGRKLNTIVWSLLAGLILYGLLRLILRKPLGAALQPMLRDLEPDDLDEISYRTIAIGFPIYTLGALIFAMIWAKIAWGRFWGWDPKEVWALITWLFYSVYLHLRLSRGFIGKQSAWLAVVGFIIVMFTLVGVNLVISGLHSYAGVS